MPATKDEVTGFEIVRGTPIIALSDGLVALKEGQARQLPLDNKISGLSVDAKEQLRIQTAQTVESMETTGFKRDDQMGARVKGRLVNSGNRVFMDMEEKDGAVSFRLLREDGNELPIANLSGQLHAASWNKEGLAAVVNDSLIVWEAGGSQLVRLRVDAGLHLAKDVCLVGHNRAVVALPDAVVLVTSETQTILVGFSAKCNWRESTLYLLDKRSGLIWSIAGLDKIGARKGDVTHAEQILNELPLGASETSPRFLEAARIVGCRKAQSILFSRQQNKN
jgi:hypothetical protein